MLPHHPTPQTWRRTVRNQERLQRQAIYRLAQERTLDDLQVLIAIEYRAIADLVQAADYDHAVAVEQRRIRRAARQVRRTLTQYIALGNVTAECEAWRIWRTVLGIPDF